MPVAPRAVMSARWFGFTTFRANLHAQPSCHRSIRKFLDSGKVGCRTEEEKKETASVNKQYTKKKKKERAPLGEIEGTQSSSILIIHKTGDQLLVQPHGTLRTTPTIGGACIPISVSLFNLMEEYS